VADKEGKAASGLPLLEGWAAARRDARAAKRL